MRGPILTIAKIRQDLLVGDLREKIEQAAKRWKFNSEPARVLEILNAHAAAPAPSQG